MAVVFLGLLLPCTVIICVFIGIPSLICYTVYRIRYKGPKVIYKEVYRDPPKPDKERVKIGYRIDMLDTFLRGSFKNVKSWKVLGDADGMHDMFFTYNILKCNEYHIIIYFLDGTQKECSVDISAFKRIEEERLSFTHIPKPDNEQGVKPKKDPPKDKWAEYKKTLPNWGTPSNQAIWKMYDEGIYEVNFDGKVMKLILANPPRPDYDKGEMDASFVSVNENNVLAKDKYKKFMDILFEDIKTQEKRSFEFGQYSGTFIHNTTGMEVPDNLDEYPQLWLRKEEGRSFYFLIDRNSIIIRENEIKYTVKIPLNKDFWNKVY